MPVRTHMVPQLDCAHVDTCLPDYWQGDQRAHIQVPVYPGMSLADLKSALHGELNQGAVSGSDERTYDNSGDVGDTWYYRAHAAVNRISLSDPHQRGLFKDLEPASDDDDVTVYAYFVFVNLG